MITGYVTKKLDNLSHSRRGEEGVRASDLGPSENQAT